MTARFYISEQGALCRIDGRNVTWLEIGAEATCEGGMVPVGPMPSQDGVGEGMLEVLATTGVPVVRYEGGQFHELRLHSEEQVLEDEAAFCAGLTEIGPEPGAAALLRAAMDAAARQRATGEEAARQAKALQEEAEAKQAAAAEFRAAAQEEIAGLEQVLAEAQSLGAFCPQEAVRRAETALETKRDETETEAGRLETEAKAAMAEAQGLASRPDVAAYLAWRQEEAVKKAAAREAERRRFADELGGLRSGVALGWNAEKLEGLAKRAEAAGFGNIAGQAAEAAEGARSVVRAEAEAAIRRNKAEMKAAAGRMLKAAESGDFVVVFREAGAEPCQLVHLRAEAAQSGRLRFVVVDSCGLEQTPPEYGTLPGRVRVWASKDLPKGDITGVDEAQAGLVQRIQRGRVRLGFAINRANDDLAAAKRQTEIEAREAAQAADVPPVESDVDDVASETPVSVEEAKVEAVEAGDLEGLDASTTRRLQSAGLTSRQAVVDTVAAGDEVFVALPGLGEASLAKVKAWLEKEPDGMALIEVIASVAETQDDEPEATDEAVAGSPIVHVDAAENEGGALMVSPDRLAIYRQAFEVSLVDLACQAGIRQVDVSVNEQNGKSTMTALYATDAEKKCVSTSATVNGGGTDDIVAAVGQMVAEIESRVAK